MIEVPSILIVAPRGMVKELIFSETPIFLAKVPIDNGIVALDVAVENANCITGKNLRKKTNGFSPANSFNIPR